MDPGHTGFGRHSLEQSHREQALAVALDDCSLKRSASLMFWQKSFDHIHSRNWRSIVQSRLQGGRWL